MNAWRAQLNQLAVASGPRRAIKDDQFDFSWRETEQVFKNLSMTSFGLNRPTVIAGQRNTQVVLAIAHLLTNDAIGITLEKSQIASTLGKIHQPLPDHDLLIHEADLTGFGEILKSLNYDFQNPIVLDCLGSDRLLGRVVLLSSTTGLRKNEQISKNCGWLLLTSGTTAAPKIVQLEKSDLVKRAMGEIRDFEIAAEDTILNLLPVSHDVGFNQVLSWWMSGATLIVQSNSSLARLRKNFLEEKITGISGTPLLWSSLMRTASAEEKFEAVRFITISGGVMTRAGRLNLKNLFPKADVYRTYGQTETFRSLILKNRLEDDTHGLPVSEVQLRLIDDRGADVADGTTGELVHSGPGTMIGYLPTKTLVSEVRTGDFFVRKSNGEFHYIGRNDDLIKRWEIRMHLSEVEEVIKGHSGVLDVCVLHRPCSDHRQNELAAFVVLDKRNAQSDLPMREAIMQSCMVNLSASKIPDLVVVIGEFPKTASQKIDRQALRAIWENTDAQ
ncbi:MAG: class I adenylate-forming enzyme family protein [Bdellovibrionales bacterium]|nr:class I adenylate-forming enzyme family protein [Bdellovibrionales bacterium]